MRADAKCRTCRWFAYTECRFRAPYPVQGAPNDRRIFPIVNAEDSCGDWGVSLDALRKQVDAP